MLESEFQAKVKLRLDSLIKQGIPLYYFVKEAGAIRGIADIVGCVGGQFFAWELKRDRSEAQKTSGRIVLQRYTLQRVQNAGGVGEIVHPENLEEAIQRLLKLLPQQPDTPSVSPSAAKVNPQVLKK